MKNNNKNYTDIILEKIEDKFDLIYEGQKDLRKKFDLMADDMDGVKSDIIDIKRDARVLKEDMKDVKSELKIKADKEVVENHENRLIKLESKVLTG